MTALCDQRSCTDFNVLVTMVNVISYLFLRFFLGLFALLPLSAARRLSWVLGWLYYWFGPKRVDIARINIQLCFPQLSAAEQEQLVKQSILQAAMWIGEAGMAWLWPIPKILKYVTIRNPDVLENTLAQQRAVILALPHMGNWEVVNAVICSRYSFSCLYKPDDGVPLLSKFILQRRSASGIVMATADAAGIRTLVKQLKAGSIVGLLPDHKPTAEMGVFAPFFGTPALTGTLISSLARKYGAAVITITVVRTAEGFEVVYDEVSDQQSNDPQVAATALNQAIERCIALAPAQFQWVYTRFSKQPDGLPSPYKQIPANRRQ